MFSSYFLFPHSQSPSHVFNVCITAKSPPAATPNVPSLADPKKVLMCVCVKHCARRSSRAKLSFFLPFSRSPLQHWTISASSFSPIFFPSLSSLQPIHHTKVSPTSAHLHFNTCFCSMHHFVLTAHTTLLNQPITFHHATSFTSPSSLSLTLLLLLPFTYLLITKHTPSLPCSTTFMATTFFSPLHTKLACGTKSDPPLLYPHSI